MFIRLALCLAFLLSASVVLAEPKFSELTRAERAELDANRAEISQYIAPESQANFQTAAGKLDALKTIVAAGILKPFDSVEIAGLGTTFGDAFVLDLGMHWVRIRDDFGTTIGLRYKETSIVLAPIDIMFKREGEIDTLDFFDMYNFYAAIVLDMAAKGM